MSTVTLPIRLNETQLGALGPQTTLLAVPPEVAEIHISNKPLAIDLVQRFIDEGEEKKMPAVMKQFRNKYNFYLVDNLKATLQMKSPNARGAKNLHLEGTFQSEDVVIEDVGPDTEWVPKNYSLSFTLDIDSQILKLIPLPITGVAPKLQFKYNWNPKVAKVVSGGTNQDAFWLFQGDSNKPRMDGDNQLTIAFRTPKVFTDKVIFKVKGTAEIDLAGEADDAAIQSQDVEFELP